jgi:hypothetical protein
MNCPHCQSANTNQYQKQTSLGYHVFRCHSCQVTFNERSGTPFNVILLQQPLQKEAWGGKLDGKTKGGVMDLKDEASWQRSLANFMAPFGHCFKRAEGRENAAG